MTLGVAGLQQEERTYDQANCAVFSLFKSSVGLLRNISDLISEVLLAQKSSFYYYKLDMLKPENIKITLMKTTVFFCLMYSCEFMSLINGYFLKDCTVKGSLKSETMKVLCYNRDLCAVPQRIPWMARVLDISYNKISVIDENDFQHLFNLQNLNVSNNLVKEVEDGAFEDLAALQELNLAHNKLTSISGGFFRNLFNLTLLRLDENCITSINPSAFLPLISLVMLNLSGNHLYDMYKIQPVFQMPQIQELHIGKNGFSSFQTMHISNTSTYLKVLDLSYNPLQLFSITADVFPLLETLDLAFINVSIKWDVQDKKYFRNVNRLNISGVPMATEELKILLQTFTLVKLNMYYLGEQTVKMLAKTVCQITSLRTLHLQLNNISSISEMELKGCTGLTVLDVSKNNLTNISTQSFKTMRNLQSLDICHNKLRNVPAAIRNLSTLEILDLSYNSITTLTCSDLASLTQLKKLHIYQNPLSSLEQCTFQSLYNLKRLLLGSGRLFTLKGYFMKGLHNLEYLELSHSKLNIIHPHDFVCLISLKSLFLQDNQIENIEPGAFIGLHNLSYLDLQSNKITSTSVRSSIFSDLKNLSSLILNNNYISYSTQNRLRQPPFIYLESLSALDIYSQGNGGMKNLPSNFLEGLKSLRMLIAGNLNINSIHPDTFTYTPNLWLLDLSKNALKSLCPEIFMPLKNLSILIMIQVRMQTLDFLIQVNLIKLQRLVIRKNSISVINATIIESLPKLSHLDLQVNEFSCECDNAWFINWAVTNNNTQVLSIDKFTCNYPSNLRGSRLIDLDLNSCTVDVGFFCFITTTFLVLLTLLSSFLYHFLKWQVIYAYYLFLAFVYDKRQKEKQKLQGVQYDAFISYNSHDEPWVMRELLPQLEDKQGWRLCVHHRDFQPGKPIIDNIVDGIYSSRKTICVISRHYLESEWCSREIQVASFRLFDEKNDVLILVFLEDIPMHELSPYYRIRSLIKKHTYLSWTKSQLDTQVFWQKLKTALQSNLERRT